MSRTASSKYTDTHSCPWKP